LLSPTSPARDFARSCASVRRRRRGQSAVRGSGGAKHECRVGSLTASPQVDQPVGEQRAPRDEVVRRQWGRVERLESQDAVPATGRAEPAGRHPPAMGTGPGRQGFVLRAERGLTERAAQPVRLRGARRRRGGRATQFDRLFFGTGSPNRFGHDDPSSRGLSARPQRRIATSVRPNAKIRSPRTLAPIRSCDPGRSTS